MNSEHDSLVRTLEDLRKKISDTYQNVLTLEVSVNNRGSAAEEALDSYNYLLSDLGLFPPLPPPYQDLDLTLELKTGTSNLDELLVGADIHRVIKPTLTEIAEAKRSERRHLENERIQSEHELDQLLVNCETLETEITAVEADVGALNDQADELRDVSICLGIRSD
jgi:kinetochore protein NDC80